jgi:excisionase family DNA binding protein
MAKMFYTLNETAETLGITDDQVRNLANEGKLQQFRDRDQLMFKRDQVDAMAANAASFTDDEDERSTGLLTMTDDGTATLADADISGGDVQLSRDNAPSAGSGLLDLDLSSDMDEPPSEPKDPRQETGISIFDADEMGEAADPMAATQVSESIDDEVELALQSIGSGSGLLDLTREADDTSLGAELLDEIYPGEDPVGTAPTDFTAGLEGPSGTTGVFDSMAEQTPGAVMTPVAAPGPGAVAGGPVAIPDVLDMPGSGFGSGMIFGALVALIGGMIMVASVVGGTTSELTTWLVDDGMGGIALDRVYYVAAGLVVGSIIFGVVGMFIGKARAK